MFKVECLCDDRYLADILRALASGKALNVNAVPVINAVAGSNGQVHAKTGGRTMELFQQWLHDKKLTRIAKRDVQQFQTDHHRAADAYGYVLKGALASGVLKLTPGSSGAQSTYDVVATSAPVADTDDSAEQFKRWVRAKNLAHVTLKEMRQFQTDFGRKPLGATSMAMRLQKAGLLKRPKGSTKRNGYQVTL